MLFQKKLDESTPSWVRRRAIEHRDRSSEYPLVDDRATLTRLAQTATLELHLPQWRFGRTGMRRNPDRLVLDLDPGESAVLLECAEVARYAREILDSMRLASLPVTIGSTGIHLYAALDGRQGSDEVSRVARRIGEDARSRLWRRREPGVNSPRNRSHSSTIARCFAASGVEAIGPRVWCRSARVDGRRPEG
jgi:DNA primase